MEQKSYIESIIEISVLFFCMLTKKESTGMGV